MENLVNKGKNKFVRQTHKATPALNQTTEDDYLIFFYFTLLRLSIGAGWWCSFVVLLACGRAGILPFRQGLRVQFFKKYEIEKCVLSKWFKWENKYSIAF